MRLLSMVPRDLLLAEPQEARSIVVEDVALVLVAQEGGLLNHGDGTFNHFRSHHLV